MPEAKQEVGGKPYTCQYDFRWDIRSEFVKETTSGQRHAGYSVPRVTQEMRDAIYGRILSNLQNFHVIMLFNYELHLMSLSHGEIF